jgi:hypothetical protein
MGEGMIRIVGIAGVIIACIGVAIIARLWWPQGHTSWDLAPGDYALSMVATQGSMVGETVRGRLTLKPTSDADTSPRTGQRAKGPPDTRFIPLYGWTDIDLNGVAAPICPEGPEPPPSSHDPVFPGVLVLKLDPSWKLASRVMYRKEVPILVIGTGPNIRDGSQILDGCGIGLFVQHRDGRCLRGEWAEWGLKADGRGTFTLCP